MVRCDAADLSTCSMEPAGAAERVHLVGQDSCFVTAPRLADTSRQEVPVLRFLSIFLYTSSGLEGFSEYLRI